jgi:heparin/heparan-sulfate lyase
MEKEMHLRAPLSAMFIASLAVLAHAAPTIPKPNPVIPTGAWAPYLKVHPRLYGSKEFLQNLAKENSTLARGGTDTLLGASIAHIVSDLPKDEAEKHIQAAMKNVNAGVTNVHQDTWIALSDAALTFDSFYEHITPADRKKMIEWFNGHLGKFTTDENAFHNSTLSKIFCYLRVAYATSGDNPRAKEFRDYALLRLYEGKVVPILRELGAGGGFTECGWYTRGSLWNLVQGLEMARRFEKYDGYALAPQFFYQRMAYELHQSYPGTWRSGTERYAVEGDGANTYSIATEYPRFTRNVLAQYFRGSDLAGYVAAKNRSGSNAMARLFDALYQAPADAPRPLETVPLAHLAEGIGKIYARSDWSKDATWFRFECGPFFTNHQHLEVGNFEIFRHEPLATESGEYSDYDDSHAVNWLSRTVAHNSILVYNPSEQFPRMRNSAAKVANDGGQAYPFGNVADNLNDWKARRQQFQRGQIAAYENKPEWMYVAANCTPAYSPEKVSLFVRQVVYLRPATFVIFDRVVSRRPDFPKVWLLHCHNEPIIEGGNVSIRNGSGALAVRTLLPASPKVTAVNGYTYPAFNSRESFPAPKSTQTEGAHLWRMEVSPSKPAAEDLFLHVLSTDGAPEAKLTQDSGKVTVTIDNVQVIFTGKAGGEIVTGSKRIPLPQKVVKGPWE